MPRCRGTLRAVRRVANSRETIHLSEQEFFDADLCDEVGNAALMKAATVRIAILEYANLLSANVSLQSTAYRHAD
jgi:hypothetical protein